MCIRDSGDSWRMRERTERASVHSQYLHCPWMDFAKIWNPAISDNQMNSVRSVWETVVTCMLGLKFATTMKAIQTCPLISLRNSCQVQIHVIYHNNSPLCYIYLTIHQTVVWDAMLNVLRVITSYLVRKTQHTDRTNQAMCAELEIIRLLKGNIWVIKGYL